MGDLSWYVPYFLSSPISFLFPFLFSSVGQGTVSTPRIRHPPQRIVVRRPPHGRAHRLCETRERRCHGVESSRRMAVYHYRVVSSRHPFARPTLPGVRTTIGWLRLPHPTACVLALTLVRRYPPPVDRCADLPGYRGFSMSSSTRPRTPGSTGAALIIIPPNTSQSTWFIGL